VLYVDLSAKTFASIAKGLSGEKASARRDKKKRLVRSSMDRIALLEIPLSMSINSLLIINRLLERLTRVHIIISALNCCASKFLCKYYLSAYLLNERAARADIVMSVQESINKQSR